MAVQEAMSAFGPAWIARSFQMSWRAAGAVAHTKIEVSVNAYAVFKVQRVNSPLTKETARFFVQNDTIFLIVHKNFTVCAWLLSSSNLRRAQSCCARVSMDVSALRVVFKTRMTEKLV